MTTQMRVSSVIVNTVTIVLFIGIGVLCFKKGPPPAVAGPGKSSESLAWLHCPVIDKTGLTGKYDFELQWTAREGAETGPKANWPSLFTAVREQLGLKLEQGKGPVPFLVVDHAEMPSGN